MTTHCTGFSNGRFGHPVQDRAISLREAALLQSFPPTYQFVNENCQVNVGAISRHIGNAVPPNLAAAIGKSIIEHLIYHQLINP
jgi:DNA (cytosine-5)-methyltransferase 1